MAGERHGMCESAFVYSVLENDFTDCFIVIFRDEAINELDSVLY
jgi:hypothetical protein